MFISFYGQFGRLRRQGKSNAYICNTDAVNKPEFDATLRFSNKIISALNAANVTVMSVQLYFHQSTDVKIQYLSIQKVHFKPIY